MTGSDPRRAARWSSSAAPGSSAATSSTACSPTPASSGSTVYDNFSSGRVWHLEQHADDPRLDVVRGDVQGPRTRSPTPMAGHDAVIHLASNPDIARAATEPDHRLRRGHAAHAPRRRGDARATAVERILYASGSGVYGDLGEHRGRPRTTARSIPISTYGASKLAGEALISAYCLHVRPARPWRSASATSSARARPTASASTSCAAARGPDAPARSSATARRASRTSTSTTWSTPCSAARRAARSRSPRSTSRPATTSPSREIAELAVECVGLDPATRRVRVHAAATGAGRATCRSCASTRRASAATRAGADPTRRATRCRRR